MRDSVTPGGDLDMAEAITTLPSRRRAVMVGGYGV